MFGTIRRHQTWLWVIIAGVTIFSFIWYFNPAARSGNRSAQGSGNYGVINGHAISASEFEDAEREVALYFLLNGQRADQNSAEFRIGTYQTLFLDSKAEELGIQITPEAAAQFARRNL